jgi:hypothetical protein
LTSTTTTTTIENHIQSYSQNWERLAAAVSNETDETTFAGILKPLTQSDVAKTAFFLGTLNDKYSLVVQSITFQDKLPSFHSVTLTLRQLATNRPSQERAHNQTTISPTTAFAANRQDRICNYCKRFRGTSSRGHDENECRNKKFDTSRKNIAQYATDDSTNNNTTYESENSEWAFSTTTKPGGNNQWIYDTGASTHITPRLEPLENPCTDNTKVWTASGKYEVATYRGDVTITQKDPSTNKLISVKITNILCLPNSPQNLLSGQCLR